MEDASKTIAHQIGGVQSDALRFGLHGVKSDIIGSHPLESSQQSAMRMEERMKRNVMVNLYGTAFPLKMELDSQILSSRSKKLLQTLWCHQLRLFHELSMNLKQRHKHNQAIFQRPPGAIPSSMLGLEAYTGKLDDFGFEDYLNDPRESETFRPLDLHHGMEVRLGLSKGPVCPSFV